MKMNFLLQNKNLHGRRQGSSSRKLVIVLVVALLCIGVNAMTFGSISRTLHSIGIPLWSTEANVFGAFDNIFAGLSSKKALLDENRRLQDIVDRDTFILLSTEVLRLENEDLRALLGRTSKGERIAAGVLARPNRTLYDTFVVDAGWTAGVTVGSLVYGVGDIAIGTIAEVYAGTSVVSLYSTPGRDSDVFIDTDKDPIAIRAHGRGDGDFEADIPRGIEVSQGALVFLPGLGGGEYPAYGGVLGSVGEVRVLPADAFQRILFSSPVNLQTLRSVVIEL